MYSLLLTYFLLAITVSFLCSLWESVLLSITPSFAQIRLQEGTRLGRQLKSFKENIDRPLAAILTLNTIAHTIGAIGVGAEATKIWAEANPLITGLVVPVVMTLGILVLSEIIPKTIGANYWRELAGFTANSLDIIIRLLLPFVWASQHLTKALKKDKQRSVFSRSDFLALAEIGARHGVFDASESTIIGNLLKFNTVCARDVMTPRTVVKAASQDMSIAAFFEANRELRHSRVPVYEGDQKDAVTGYILKSEMLARLAEERGQEPLKAVRRDIIVVNETFPIPELFSRFLEKREHIALVVDEFGGMAGIVTMEDVIETLLGMEIVDELDATADMQQLARRTWERRARLAGLIEEAAPAPATEPDDEADAPDDDRNST